MEDIRLESFPFDSMKVLNEESGQMEDDRLYEAKVFRQYFRKFLSNGVYYGDYKDYKENSMKVTSDGGMNIKIAKGAGIIEGADFENTEERIISLERPATGNRIDRVVVQFNASLDTRNTLLYVKQGEAGNPASLQRDDNIFEICLAEILVKSTANISQDDITDKRTNNDLCGIVNSLISVDGEELYQAFKDYIEEITDNLVLKNQDNIIEGKMEVKGGIKTNVVGTATKLETARAINLEGAVKGSANFDGSKNITINTTQDNIAILTGNFIAEGNKGKISAELNYPSGFNKDNCTILSFGGRTSTTYGYAYGHTSNNSAGLLFGTNDKVVFLEDKIRIWYNNTLTSEQVFYYKIVLMKLTM